MARSRFKILLLTTQRLSDLSGINTYIREFEGVCRECDQEIVVLSTVEISLFRLCKQIWCADWVHLNTADPVAFTVAKLLRKKILQRFHYTFWGTTHTENFVPIGFLRRIVKEVWLRWGQSGFREPSKLGWFAEQMVRLGFRVVVGLGADRVVTCSQMLTKALELPRDCFTIYYPFKMEVHSERRIKERFVLFCGRVDRPKGLENVIRAIEMLRSKGIDVRLKIAGDGPDRSRLELIAGELGVSDLVEWHGRVDASGVSTFMSRAQALVVPSISNDPSPFVVLEAALGETPVIGSKRGGIPEEVGEGGWIIDPESVEELTRALRDAWQSPGECAARGQLLRKHVERRFAPTRSLQATLALMQSPSTSGSFGAVHHRGAWLYP